MSSPRPSRAVALLLSLVPGWGHVYVGRERAGLALFTLWALSVFAYVNLTLLYSGAVLWTQLALSFVFFFWLASLLGTLRATSPGRLRRLEDQKGKLLREGMVAYLRGELAAAEEAFRACLRLDAHEVEALLRLGVVEARLGRERQARRTLRRTRRMDLEEKWGWEVEEELRRLRRGPRPAGRRPRAGTGEAGGGEVKGTEAGLPEGPGRAPPAPLGERRR